MGEIMPDKEREKRREYMRNYYKNRRLSDPEFREKEKERNRNYVRNRRLTDPDYREKWNKHTREYMRNRRITDPDFREKENEYWRNRYKNDERFREKEKERVRNHYKNDACFYITRRMRMWKRQHININTWKDYQVFFKKANRQCQICSKPLKLTTFEKGNNEVAVLDHDPITGQIRGILCRGCNVALGFIEKYLDKAQNYISNQNIKLNK